MTAVELNALATERGFKGAADKGWFRAGYRDAVDGKRGTSRKKAYRAGYDLGVAANTSTTRTNERVIDVDGAAFTVVVQPSADSGFEVIVPIEGQTESVYGDTEEVALEVATERLRIATAERARGALTNEMTTTIDVAGATWDVVQRDFETGAFTMHVATYPDIEVSGTIDDDADAAIEQLREKLAERIGALAEAQTVDGERAVIERRQPAPQLPLRTSIECATEVHRCQDELTKKTAAENRAKEARKSAENALAIANQALLEAVDREAAEREKAPELPIGAPA